MNPDPARNVQSGRPTAQRADEPQPLIARADRHDGYYVDDPDQLAKAVHQVKPSELPTQGPADFERHGTEDTSIQDVAVTPDAPSVWEARPDDDKA